MTLLANGVDVFFAVNADGDEFADLIGIEGDTVYWIEASNESGTTWASKPVGKVEKARTQGYTAARLVPGTNPQLIFTRGKNLYVLEVPSDPIHISWPLHCISTANEEEGIAAGDIDGDGDLDIAAVQADGHDVIWLENPGALILEWKVHAVGRPTSDPQVCLDRVALADLNGDGRLDIIVTEERQDWKLEAHLYWFEAPADPKVGKWNHSVIARHRSLNSMDIADVDGDNVVDIVVAEHTDQKSEWAQDNLTTVYLNKEKGRTWLPNIVERGSHSSHLGARLIDLDNDGRFELVSIGWSQYRQVHLWKMIAPDLR